HRARVSASAATSSAAWSPPQGSEGSWNAGRRHLPRAVSTWSSADWPRVVDAGPVLGQVEQALDLGLELCGQLVDGPAGRADAGCAGGGGGRRRRADKRPGDDVDLDRPGQSLALL